MDNIELNQLQELASLGKTDAINSLIDYYLSNQDFKRAFLTAQRFEYFISAEGYKGLAVFYQKGIGTLVDLNKANYYYQKSYELGDLGSGFYLASDCIKKKEYESALSYLANGVNQEHIPSIRLLAIMHLNGYGVPKDSEAAIKLYLKAIELGDDKSIDTVARIYYSLKDYSNSFKYFELGANIGNLDSIYHLGLSYAKGLGVKQDFSLAVKYYEIGANKLEPRCLYNLSIYYRNGIVVNQNIDLANKLEEQAYQNGFKK